MQERSNMSVSGRNVIGKNVRYACYVLVLFIVLADCLPSISEPMINTKWGPIRGKWSNSMNGRPIANFLGIPYALPPVGDLRFQSPLQWNQTWTTTRDNTHDGPKCTQLYKSEIIGGEDCLYLNVFVPMIPGNQAKLSVMVFVHGGKFEFGSSDSKLYAPDYLLNYDVILVTLNYRLGALGFFSTANRVAPGNYGLKDVVTALHWVQENIYDFGGDPESVTLMGSSAGAITTHMLALSYKTKGLFHRYILHSCTAINPVAIHSKQLQRRISLELAKLVGCLPNATASNETIVAADLEKEIWQCGDVYNALNENEEQDEEMMKCMRTVDTDKMLKMTDEMSIWMSNPCCPFSPTLEEESEDAIVTIHPFKAIKDKLFRDIPAIILVVKDEGLVKTLDIITGHNAVNELKKNFEQYMLYLIEYMEVVSNTSIFADAIQDAYLSENLTESEFLSRITNMVGDGLITWPLFQAVQYQSEIGTANVYFSYFAYQGTFSWTFNSNSHHYGVSHGDDLNYLFPCLNNMFANLMLHNTEDDRKIIHIMTEMWTNFARYGIPSAWMIPTWPSYRDNHQFMRFGNDRSPDIAVQADFLPSRMGFWEKLMANVSTECNVERNASANDSPENMTTGKAAGVINHRLRLDLAILAILFVGALKLLFYNHE